MTYYILSDNEGLKIWKANDIKEELLAMAIKALYFDMTRSDYLLEKCMKQNLL